jgi:APA family basic amino acid/polyamine antiporter
MIYGQTRILFAISRDGLVPKVFQKVDARTMTPVGNTIIVCVAVGLVAGLVDSEFLWDMVSMGTLTAFGVVSIAVPVLRYKQRAAPQSGFRLPFGPYLVPSLSIAACLYIMKSLSLMTLHVFTMWMTCAILIYLLYGLRNSGLNKIVT